MVLLSRDHLDLCWNCQLATLVYYGQGAFRQQYFSVYEPLLLCLWIKIIDEVIGLLF